MGKEVGKMQATAMKEEFVDPVCGMTVDPARAAGTSERDGVRYYFCSPGCKQKFDAAGADESFAGAGCCGGGEATAPVQLSPAPVQLTSLRRSPAGREAAAHAQPAHEGHAHH